MKSLQSAFATLQSRQITVLGVSMDSVEKNRAFAEKFGLTFPLVCDVSGEVCDAFEVAHPDGKPVRHTFFFEDGRLVFRDYSVSPRHQAQDILMVVDAIEARR